MWIVVPVEFSEWLLFEVETKEVTFAIKTVCFCCKSMCFFNVASLCKLVSVCNSFQLQFVWTSTESIQYLLRNLVTHWRWAVKLWWWKVTNIVSETNRQMTCVLDKMWWLTESNHRLCPLVADVCGTWWAAARRQPGVGVAGEGTLDQVWRGDRGRSFALGQAARFFTVIPQSAGATSMSWAGSANFTTVADVCLVFWVGLVNLYCKLIVWLVSNRGTELINGTCCSSFVVCCQLLIVVYSICAIFSEAKATVPGSWNMCSESLTDWLIDYAIFLHRLAMGGHKRNKIWHKGNLGDEDDAQTSNTRIEQRNHAIPHSILKTYTRCPPIDKNVTAGT